MIRKVAVAAAIVSMGLSGVAVAAQPVSLGSVKGSVLVNQNGKFSPVKSSTTLRAGDRVLAKDGSAELIYADGCKVSLTARSMATIGAQSPCGGSSDVVKASYATAMADDGYDDGGTGADFWLYVGMGLLTVGVVGAALGDDEHPTSP